MGPMAQSRALGGDGPKQPPMGTHPTGYLLDGASIPSLTKMKHAFPFLSFLTFYLSKCKDQILFLRLCLSAVQEVKTK